jgi:hypothetical protein
MSVWKLHGTGLHAWPVPTIACAILAACATPTTNHYVIASTGTVIGVEVSQNPANQTPQAKLGYDRAELALVPTARPTCTIANDNSAVNCAPATGDHVKDVPDVLMELRYGGIFDLGASSGIYQRLAVGQTAVSRPGAEVLFARNSDGDLQPGTLQALAISSHDALALDAINRAAQTGKLDQLKTLAAKSYDQLSADELTTLGDITGALSAYSPALHAAIRKQLQIGG